VVSERKELKCSAPKKKGTHTKKNVQAIVTFCACAKRKEKCLKEEKERNISY
jgi:hypothetical protein